MEVLGTADHMDGAQLLGRVIFIGKVHIFIQLIEHKTLSDKKGI